MTPEERAEKICRIYERYIYQSREQAVILILNEIREAVQEGVLEAFDSKFKSERGV